jgi:uncharacterized integral membrane protein
MPKNKMSDRDFQYIDDENVIEVHQNPNKKFQLIFGIVSGILCFIFIVNNVSYLRSAVWWLSVPVGYLVVASIIQLYLRLFVSPQKIYIRQNIMTIYMLYKDKQDINIAEIERIEHKGIFSPVVEASGWLVCPARNLRYYIAKPFYYKSGFDDFIRTIKERNPKCEIDRRILDWEGPYSAI